MVVSGQRGTRLPNSNKGSIVVGLTGGIASGKSTVSTLLKERSVPVIDADILAREVVAPGTPGLRAIIGQFGTDILSPDGSLDRKKLGDIIFKDAKKRTILNGIVHPAVRRAMLREVVRCWWSGESVCVLDVPLLVEAGLWRWVGFVVVIYWSVPLVFNPNLTITLTPTSSTSSDSSRELQMKRLMIRDNLTQAAAQDRLSAQMPLIDKVEYANKVIENSGGPQELACEVDVVASALRRKAGWTWRLSWWFPPLAIVMAIWRIIERNVQFGLFRRGKRVSGAQY